MALAPGSNLPVLKEPDLPGRICLHQSSNKRMDFVCLGILEIKKTCVKDKFPNALQETDSVVVPDAIGNILLKTRNV